jgi:acyl carrier protein phosphodiesterase
MDDLRHGTNVKALNTKDAVHLHRTLDVMEDNFPFTGESIDTAYEMRRFKTTGRFNPIRFNSYVDNVPTSHYGILTRHG